MYYDTKGEAEGIVCWIADTLFIKTESPRELRKNDLPINPEMVRMISRVNVYHRTPTYAFDSVDGRVNTAIHMALRSDTSQYLFKERIEAAKWCTDKGEGWYFPAKYEMLNVLVNVDLFNVVLIKIGGTLFNTDYLSPESSGYWTSTEVPGPYGDFNYYFACSFYLYFGEIYFQEYQFYYQLHVRAMKWFNEP